MKSELRNLPAIALGERTEDEDYSFFCADDGPEKRLLELCVPTFKEIVDVAKDYDITNVRETIAELSRVTEIYLSRWEER